MDADMVDEEEAEAADLAKPRHDKADDVIVDDDIDDDARASEVEDLTAEIAVATLSDDGLLDAEIIDPIAEAQAERDQFKDIALRLQADFDNYRRRMAQVQTAEVDRATGKMAEALLPVLDAAENAFLQHPAEVEPLFNLLLGELRKQGLESMNLLEQPFDPAHAEAVMHEAGDGGEPIVSEVLRSGYTWKGRVLRAAMVKVRG